jgi:hypothetical protein
MTRLGKVFVFIGVVVVVLYAIDYSLYPNLRACNSLTQGITEPELTSKLGAFTSKDIGNGQMVLYFASHPVAAGPISARINKNTGTVLELRCEDDGAPLWSVLDP